VGVVWRLHFLLPWAPLLLLLLLFLYEVIGDKQRNCAAVCQAKLSEAPLVRLYRQAMKRASSSGCCCVYNIDRNTEKRGVSDTITFKPREVLARYQTQTISNEERGWRVRELS